MGISLPQNFTKKTVNTETIFFNMIQQEVPHIQSGGFLYCEIQQSDR